jgi:predicted transcriptional regulator of viral defense system
MESERSRRWRTLLQSQSGVISRRQALAAGWPEKTIDRRLRSGAWRRIERGVYGTFTGELSRNARLWAAVLRVGPGAALSHETAAETHGITSKPSTRIHISVPAQRAPVGRICGVVIHRSRGLAAEWQPPWQLPRTSVEDTVLDLVSAARNFDDAYGWISAAVGRRLTTPDLLS